MHLAPFATKKEDVAALYGRQTPRQYSNKRVRKKIQDNPSGLVKDTLSQGGGKNEKSLSSSKILQAASQTALSKEPIVQMVPQVIVRTFTLPPFSNASFALPIQTSRNGDFGKPKQRWKQLCNLQHELTTSLPLNKVQMKPSSTPLIREFVPGTLHKLNATGNVIFDTIKLAKEGASSPTNKPSNKNQMSPQKDTAVFKPGSTEAENVVIDVVPEVAAEAEISSTDEDEKLDHYDTNDTNVGNVEGGLVIIQEPKGDGHVVEHQDVGNITKMQKHNVLTSDVQSVQTETTATTTTAATTTSTTTTATTTPPPPPLPPPYSGPKEITNGMVQPLLIKGNQIPNSNLNTIEQHNGFATPRDSSSLKTARDSLRNALFNTQPQILAVIPPIQTPEQNKIMSPQIKTNLQKSPVLNIGNKKDINAKCAKADTPNKAMSARKIQNDLALMKVRQSIAFQVEREVLRRKEEKKIEEVELPARKVVLATTGSQTNLFSLVEPGRMVEMSISSDTEEKKMVSPSLHLLRKKSSGSQKPSNVAAGGSGYRVGPMDMSGEIVNKNIVSNGAAVSSDEPDKKRPRLDGVLACHSDSGSFTSPDARTTQNASDTMSVDSGIDVTPMDCQTSLQSKNINILSVNLGSSSETSKPDSLQHLGNKVSEYSVNQGSNNATNCGQSGTSEQDQRSVFDIIVQHNISSHSKKPRPTSPTENNVSGTSARTSLLESIMSNTPNNMNVQESTARLAELRLQAYKDWRNCLRSDSMGNIPLHKAVLAEKLTLVKRQCVVLCARKADLDVHNTDKETPLHLAVLSGNADITQLLVSFGAQPSVKDGDGNTALHLAILHGNLQCVNAILNSGNKQNLPLNEYNDEGYGPVHISVLNRKLEETKALIRKGADVNLKDAKSGRTPLFHAVEVNSGELVQFILQNDGSPNEPNFSGHTPLSAASEISYTERNVVKQYSISDGINFSSKLMSLSKGTEVNLMGGDLLEDVPMDEVSDNAVGAHCLNNASRSGKKSCFYND